MRLTIVGLAAAGLLAAAPASGAGERDNIVCRGIDTSADSRDAVSPSQSDFVWFRDFGFTVLRMNSSVTQEDFEYVGDFMEAILPSMVEVLGPPVSLDTLTVLLWAMKGGQYNTYENLIAVDHIRRHSAAGIDRKWDVIFIHELAHAFQDDVLHQLWEPDWLSEGTAEAVVHFVGELVTQRTGRDVRPLDMDVLLAAYDLGNNAGEQILGGCDPPAWRVDPYLAYDIACGTVVVPAMAQLAAGLDDPHPLRRLTESLREEINAPPPHDLYEAIGRAWPAPVDGSTSARWLRSRSITGPSVRDGEFIALIPSYPHSNVNPEDLWILHFTRRYDIYERFPSSATLRYIDTDGHVHATYGNSAFPSPPDLPPGAYLIELEETGQEGQRLTARSWIMMIDPPYLSGPLREGVAVIFVDKNGRTVDIPREQLSVNGRITARVPGGVIVQTYDGQPSALTFMRSGRVLGTLTAIGSLPRSVVLSVDGEPRRPVVSWSPHRPVRDGQVTVTIVPERSSLDPQESGAVDVLLYGYDGTVRSRSPMSRSTVDGILETTLAVPVDLEYGILSFEKGSSRHRKCWKLDWPWYSAYEFGTRPQGAKSGVPVDIAFDGTGLVVAFDAPVDPDRLRLRIAADAVGPWTSVASGAETVAPLTFRWDVSGLIGDGAYFQAVLEGSAGGADEVLYVQYISAAPVAFRLAERPPFPNPANGVVQWPFDVVAPVEVDFDVFDVAGRRVFSSGKWTLHPGVEVFSWDSTALGRRSPAGVYFLRANGAGENFTRKIVIVR